MLVVICLVSSQASGELPQSSLFRGTCFDRGFYHEAAKRRPGRGRELPVTLRLLLLREGNSQKIRNLNILDSNFTRPRCPFVPDPYDPEQSRLASSFRFYFQLSADGEGQRRPQFCPVLADRYNMAPLPKVRAIRKLSGNHHGNPHLNSHAPPQRGWVGWFHFACLP